MIREYEKLDNKIAVGKRLYHSSSQVGWIEVLKCEEITFMAKSLNNKHEREYGYYDIGKVLFFSKDDADAYGNNNRNDLFMEKYAAYQSRALKPSLEEITDEIDKVNQEFFSGKTYKEKEFYVEKNYFDKVEKEVEYRVQQSRGKRKESDTVNNGNTESYDPDVKKNRDKVQEEEKTWNEIREKPYFAEIILTGTNDAVYIGEKEIPGKVIDYRDRNKYAEYTGIWYDKDFKRRKADLIREFKIEHAALLDFSDIVNAFNDENISGDPFLEEIIKYNRSKQELISIAQTIRNKQYEVIIRPIDEELILEGCAGSGKTMVLLHRLSSIVYNEEDLSARNFVIISPNNLLDSESKNIVKDLEIENAEKGAITSLYRKWIGQYLNETYIYKNRSFNKNYSRFLGNDQLDSEFLSLIYSREFVSEFRLMVRSAFIENSRLTGFSFYEEELKNLKRSAQNVYGGDLDTEATKNIFEYYKNMAEEYEAVCKGVSAKNVRARLHQLKEQIAKFEKPTHEAEKQQKKEISACENLLASLKSEQITKEHELLLLLSQKHMVIEIEDPFRKMIYEEKVREYDDVIVKVEDELNKLNKEIKKAEKQYQKAVREMQGGKEASLKNEEAALKAFYRYKEELQGEVVVNTSGNVSAQPRLFKSIIDYYKKYHKKIHSYIIELNGTEEEFWYNNFRMMECRKRFQHFITNREKREYLLEAIETVIRYWKEDFSISSEYHYEFELYLLLEGLSTMCGNLSGDFRLISIDEYQDCAPVEIDLLRKVFNNSVLNLYGDSHQQISFKAEDEIEKDKYEVYNLNVNYRNGKEITEYINQEFSMNMDAIGMKSEVIMISSMQLEALEVDEKKRTALIVKSKKEFENLERIRGVQTNYFIDDHCTIEKGILNVIPVRLTKGLEFEQVYVYARNMTENERYVAYTRALETLYIVS